MRTILNLLIVAGRLFFDTVVHRHVKYDPHFSLRYIAEGLEKNWEKVTLLVDTRPRPQPTLGDKIPELQVRSQKRPVVK